MVGFMRIDEKNDNAILYSHYNARILILNIFRTIRVHGW
jgi:hypothetical protein